jgi:hypothetical protein
VVLVFAIAITLFGALQCRCLGARQLRSHHAAGLVFRYAARHLRASFSVLVLVIVNALTLEQTLFSSSCLFWS